MTWKESNTWFEKVNLDQSIDLENIVLVVCLESLKMYFFPSFNCFEISM